MIVSRDEDAGWGRVWERAARDYFDEATEAERLGERVSGRTRSRLGKDKGPSAGDEKPSPAPATDLGDAEMRLDVAELNAFCTADGCVRAAREEDDDE